MSRMIDFTGQKFGKLTVVRATSERRGGTVVWECQCDCGNIVFLPSYSLKSCSTTSCGCMASKRIGRPKLDLSNQRFGKLVAIRPTDKRYGNSVVWECQCDCGNKAFVGAYPLTSGSCLSCGCVRNELKGRSVKDLSGQRFGRLLALEPTNERKHKSVVWKCQCDCGGIAYICGKSLVSDATRSCGCLRRREEVKTK